MRAARAGAGLALTYLCALRGRRHPGQSRREANACVLHPDCDLALHVGGG